ncbi:hypothetical protein, partial [Microseira wollei]|uniref:hypothetical protein n=1 Tax=Microseira wollei TaxID=467598 RepID=UPI001CFCBDF3
MPLQHLGGSPVGARQGKFLPQSRWDICRAPTAFGWFTSRETFCPSPDGTSALPLQHLGGSPVGARQGNILPQSRWDICRAPTAFGWFTSGSPVGARQGN